KRRRCWRSWRRDRACQKLISAQRAAMQQIAEWLRKLDLGQCAHRFAENGSPSNRRFIERAVVGLDPLKARCPTSRRLIWLGPEMHDLAHLVFCRIGRIQPSDPSLPSFNVGKELPMA